MVMDPHLYLDGCCAVQACASRLHNPANREETHLGRLQMRSRFGTQGRAQMLCTHGLIKDSGWQKSAVCQGQNDGACFSQCEGRLHL